MSVLRLKHEAHPVDSRTVAVVTVDRAYRRALTDIFTQRGRSVIAGSDASCLNAVDGWGAEWRELDVEAIVIDLGSDIIRGLDTLDAVRRRDPHAYVIVLSRVFGALGTARVGANLILEGDVSPTSVADALTRRPMKRN